MIARRVLLTGRVQGVGFRWHAVQEATRLGVGGWVRNLADGSVESLVEGPAEAVGRMIEWLRAGPPPAAVEEVVVEPAAPSGLAGFTVI